MASQRQMKLGAFMRPTTIHTGAFPDANFKLGHLIRFAQTLERGKFDAFFVAGTGSSIDPRSEGSARA